MAFNTVKIKKYADIIEEYGAAAAITPGMLIELASVDTVQVHSTQDGDALAMFALEDELQGNGITDDYAATDRVQCWIPGRGDQVYALLANGETAVVGSWLTSNGDGYLKVQDVQSAQVERTLQIVAQALETVDMSDSSGADPSGRIVVRIV